MFRVYNKLLDYYRKKGLIYVFKKATQSIIRNFIFLFYKKEDELILIKDLSEIQNIKKNRISITEFQKEFIKKIMKLNQEQIKTKLNNRLLLNYVRNEYNGFVGLINNKIIGYIWWVDNKIKRDLNHPHLRRFNIELKDNEIYIFDFYISQEVRGSGIANEFLIKIMKNLKKNKYQRAYGVVSKDNVPAKWTYILTGWKVIKKIVGSEFLNLIYYSDYKTRFKYQKFSKVI